MRKMTISSKSFKSIALALALVVTLCMGSVPYIVNAAEPSNDDVSNITFDNVKVIDQAEFDAIAARGTILQDGRQISPGQTINGTFRLNNYRTNFTVYLAVSNGSGYVHLGFVSAAYNVNCGNSVVVARETGWPSGTYSYSVTSHASSTVAYSLLIAES